MAEIGDLWRCGCGETWIEDGEGVQDLPAECGACGLHLGPPAEEAKGCPTCGQPVKVLGGETKHYAPLDTATFNAELEAERRRADRAEEVRENANAATLRAERRLANLREWAESQANSYSVAPPGLANAGQEWAYRDVVRRIEETR